MCSTRNPMHQTKPLDSQRVNLLVNVLKKFTDIEIELALYNILSSDKIKISDKYLSLCPCQSG
jgi:hypothetical protein